MRIKTIITALILIILVGCQQSDEEAFTILFLGDTGFGESYGQNYYDHSLRNFKSILSDSDLVIANLETPLTDLANSPFNGKKEYIHFSDPVKATDTFLNHNMTVFSLANNHSMDFGEHGLKQTLDIPELSFFGAGLDDEEAAKPFNYNNIYVVGAFEYSKSYDENYSFYADENKAGVNQLFVEEISNQIKEINAKNSDAFVVVFPHWGDNYKMKNQEQTKAARELIDTGADLIIGHGSHMAQQIEKYKNKWIIYSLGNFVFNSQGRYESFDVPAFSVITRLEVKTNSLKLYPIYTNNLETNFQGRFLSLNEFEEFKEFLNLWDYEFGKDEYGYFIDLI